MLFEKTTRRAETRITETRRAETRITETTRSETRRAETRITETTRSERKKLIDSVSSDMLPESSNKFTESELGEFDDNFTWFAMILASQGKR